MFSYRIATAFITIIAIAIAVVVLLTEGLNYMDPDIGVGLHPLLAFSVATMATWLVVPVLIWVRNEVID